MSDEQNTEGKLELAASGLDLILSIAGTIAPVSTVNSIRKYIEQRATDRTIKNIQAFLNEADKATKEQKEEFKKKLGNESEEFCDHLLEAIARIDREEKAKILGKLYKAVQAGELKTEEFLRLAKVLELIYISTLKFFLTNENPYERQVTDATEIEYYNELLGLGLVSITASTEKITIDMEDSPETILKHRTSTLGNLFLDIIHYEKRTPDTTERKEFNLHTLKNFKF